MAMIFWSALLFSFKMKRFVLCLNFSVMEVSDRLREDAVCRALTEKGKSSLVDSQGLAVVEYLLILSQIHLLLVK